MTEKTKVEQLTDELAETLRATYLHLAEELAGQRGEPERFERMYGGPAEDCTFARRVSDWAADTASGEARQAEDFAGGEVSRYLLRCLNHKAAEPLPALLADEEDWAEIAGPIDSKLGLSLKRLLAQYILKYCTALDISYPDACDPDGLTAWADSEGDLIAEEAGRRIADDFAEYDDITANQATEEAGR